MEESLAKELHASINPANINNLQMSNNYDLKNDWKLVSIVQFGNLTLDNNFFLIHSQYFQKCNRGRSHINYRVRGNS